MPRRKPGTLMKSHTIRMTDEEWAEMQKCAEIADESDSEYIRKAVAMRNQNYNGSEERHRDFIHNKAKEILGINSEVQTMSAKYRLEHAAEDRKKAIEADKKQTQSPMVNTFMKGEKK